MVALAQLCRVHDSYGQRRLTGGHTLV